MKFRRWSGLLTLLGAAIPLSATANTHLNFSLGAVLGKGSGEPVYIEVLYRSAQCSSSHPLQVTIYNSSEEDITSVKFLAYAHDEDYSRAECAEAFDLSDRVIGSGESYSLCLNTLDERELVFHGLKFTNQMIDDALPATPLEFSRKYGHEFTKAQVDIAKMYLEHRDATASINPKQNFGCRKVPSGIPWRGKVESFSTFSGF
ncbi:hypothetical protein [Paracoccus sp. MC1862]|uniref:hypothetical protein n=1 Tax=Paracoccus sp. MC1862 TaxID=2760307 RepID=UPI001603072D|nr:hypothetical protein [Paracoccus sp. MC1862]MBB1498226.1 hypothetical protein [Paracoccus sp. MC1862]QQO45716.1 hypothetical protein JGR78_05100 [Paracoccus sp. MC1862]